MPARRIVSIVASLSVALTLGACSSTKKLGGGTVTKFVDPSSTSGTSGTSGPAPSSTASSSTVAPKPPASMSTLSARCDTKLPQEKVVAAIGQSLGGITDFVVGTPDASIKRKTYINCRYGLADKNATPTIEIQVSLYGTAAEAAARIGPTVTDYESNGATARKIQVDGIPATMLTGGAGAAYSSPTVVLAYGQRTVAVGVSSDIAAAKQAGDLTALAALAVRETQ